MFGRLYLTILSICILVTSLRAQDQTPKYSNEFLSIGVGARGLAMSNSLTATVDDVTAGYWNPAGLLNIDNQYEFGLMHAEYFAGIAKYDYAGFATPIDSVSALGISIIRFGVDDIPDTRFLYDANGAINYDRIRFFSAADYAFILSYARKVDFLEGLKLGANFKVIHRVAGSFASAWGFGLDAGAQLDHKKWKFGIMVRDITGTFNAWSHNTDLVLDIYTQTGNEIPQNSIEITLPKAMLGVARAFPIKSNFGLLASLDVILSFDGKRNVMVKSDFASMDASIGFEADYKKTVFLRLGAGKLQKIKDYDLSTYWTFQPNFGLGIFVKGINIDYALTDIGDQSESLYSHVFSIKAGVNKK